MSHNTLGQIKKEGAGSPLEAQRSAAVLESAAEVAALNRAFYAPDDPVIVAQERTNEIAARAAALTPPAEYVGSEAFWNQMHSPAVAEAAPVVEQAVPMQSVQPNIAPQPVSDAELAARQAVYAAHAAADQQPRN